MTLINLTAPLSSLRDIVKTGPVSAWPDTGDWDDDEDWVIGVAYMKAFDNSSAYTIEDGDDTPPAWTSIADRVQKDVALELIQILNAIREPA